MVEGATRAEAASVLSEKLLADLSDPVRDAGSTFSASPIIHAPSGEARAGYRGGAARPVRQASSGANDR
jgi:hypothetical protein